MGWEQNKSLTGREEKTDGRLVSVVEISGRASGIAQVSTKKLHKLGLPKTKGWFQRHKVSS